MLVAGDATLEPSPPTTVLPAESLAEPDNSAQDVDVSALCQGSVIQGRPGAAGWTDAPVCLRASLIVEVDVNELGEFEAPFLPISRLCLPLFVLVP